MKKLTICSALLLSILISGTALGQYSKTSLSSDLSAYAESFVHGVPDSIYNHLKVDLKVQIKRYDDGSLSGGMQTGNVSNPYTDVLKAGQFAPVNRKDFRRSSTSNNKRIDLIITVPKMNIDELGGVNEEGIIWNLGYDHEPSYTIVKAIQNTGEMQIIIVYENGVPLYGNPYKNQNEFEGLEEIRWQHLQSHICHPGDIDPRCY